MLNHDGDDGFLGLGIARPHDEAVHVANEKNLKKVSQDYCCAERVGYAQNLGDIQKKRRGTIICFLRESPRTKRTL